MDIRYRVGRSLREKYEGRDEKRQSVVRTKKTRKWDESPSGEVKRMETNILESADVRNSTEGHFILPY
jgi:hypothetical protein